jgi:hypothetical protein
MRPNLLIHLVPVVVVLGGCASHRVIEGNVEPGWSAPANPVPGPALPTADYEGKVIYGLETRSFSPCGSAERWTLQGDLSRIKSFIADHPSVQSDSGLNLSVLFVRLRGTPSATGNYGHGGSYPREVTVHAVLEVREYLDNDCGGKPGA